MAELPRLNGIIKALEEGGVAFVGSAPADGVAGTSAPYDGALFEMEHGPYDIRALQEGLQSMPHVDGPMPEVVGRSRFHPHEARVDGRTPILTSRRDLTALEVAQRMFDRWRPENFFKYLREEYALDALVDDGVVPYDPTRDVPNPRRRALDGTRFPGTRLRLRYGVGHPG